MAKRMLGGVALLMGVAILGSVAYNLVWPTESFRSSYRTVFQFILPLAMVWYGWRWLLDIGPGVESVQIDPDAPELAASVLKARRTLPAFLEVVRRHEDGAYIKFPLVTEAGVVEHIWAYVHHYAEGVFNVSLASAPFTQASGADARRDVPASEVEDWQIMTPDGHIRGAYSLRALFEHLERKGVHLNRTMRQQRAQLLDAPEHRGAGETQHANG
jgi:uncharacterized protein YegJ (DUF2314 family)